MPNSLDLVKRIKTPTELGDLQMAEGTLVSVTGHCGKAPEMRQAGSKMVASVGVAVSWGKGDDRTTVWVECEAWDELAELLSEFDRGDAITIVGPRKSREYNGKVYWKISAWELGRPVYRKQSGAPPQSRSTTPKQSEPVDYDQYENIPF
jgi:single-stranded DNA-binding protein